MNYYRRYVGDYLKKTSRLSMLEHGAYNLLLDYYYAEESPIPLDLDEVYRMCRAILPEERRAVVKVLTTYFEKDDAGYRNPRADEEIEVALKVIDVARENGKLGGRPRKTETEDETRDITQTITETETQTVTGRLTETEPANNHPPTTNHQPPSTSLKPPALVTPILPSNIPYREIVGLFHDLMPDLARVRDFTQKRRDLIRAAWKASKRRQTLEFWKRYFEECAEDPFLNGTGPYKPPHENWRPTFDFLMKSDQVTKVYERAMHEAGA